MPKVLRARLNTGKRVEDLKSKDDIEWDKIQKRFEENLKKEQKRKQEARRRDGKRGGKKSRNEPKRG